MPESDPAVRGPAISLIQSHGIPKRVLDLGVGSGFYGRKLKSLEPSCEVYGVEIWAPYITDHLKFYQMIILADMRKINYTWLNGIGFDLVIAADVLEHFNKQECIKIVELIKINFPWFIATLPITYCPQGSYQGNESEAHLHQWTAHEVESDLGLTLVKDCGLCGLFEFRK